MQQIKVPQDVQRADQILGPLTIKQLAILIGGLLLAWLVYSVLQMAIAIPLVIIIAFIALAFAFFKIHTWSFATFLKSTLYFMLVPRVRTWQKMRDSIEIPIDELTKIQYEKAKVTQQIEKKIKDHGQVADIATLLDSRGGMKAILCEGTECVENAEDEELLQTAYLGENKGAEQHKKLAEDALRQKPTDKNP